MSFCCPSCKGALSESSEAFRCESCDCKYPIVNGIPDFYVEDPKHDFDSDASVIWLEPDIVNARNVYYELSIRELKGMDFCMREIGRRIDAGSRSQGIPASDLAVLTFSPLTDELALPNAPDGNPEV